MRIAANYLRLFTCGFVFFTAANWSAADTLYNATFSTPPNVIGALPKLGAPNGPSAINFGFPTVQASLGALDRALVFVDQPPSLGDYDQVSFGLSGAYTGYEISFDALVADHSSSFVISLDTPIIQQLSLDPDLVIRSYQPMSSDLNPPVLAYDIGTYIPNTVLHFDISVDLPNRDWAVAVNDTVLLQGPFYTKSGTVQNVRFNEGGLLVGTAGKVGLDNVLIIGTPEPASSSLVAAVFFALAILKSARRRKPAHTKSCNLT